ncbi:MAG: hypothetical protein ACM3KM_00340 [Acidobacteriaceae bacterium]
MKIHSKKQIVLVLAFFVFASFSTTFAQTAGSNPEQDEKTQLQQQLQEIENQIAAYQKELDQTRGEKNTLQNKIKTLKKQQDSLTLQIKATNLRITDLGAQITATQATIDSNTEKMEALKKQAAGLISSVYQQDEVSMLDIFLTHDNFIDAISEMENYSRLSDSLNSLLNEVAATNKYLAEEKVQLAGQQEDANNLLSIQSLQQQEVAGTVSEQNNLLSITKGRESEYQAIINDTNKRANEIRGRLYQLLGISSQITFGEAVKIAQWASSQTGVRAAFLLAILTQESNLGKNVGTCNRAGDPPEKSWRVVMKPERDQQPFQTITAELGLNIDTTPVSCPMMSKGKQVGWGGAMGPAQFIPSTWMGYKDKVTEITGKSANPWDIRDAFIASAIKLKAGGAGTVQGEWAAAMRYFSGSTNTKYRFYGDNVVKIANQYQNDIDELNN